MESIAHWVSIYVGWGAVPILSLTAIIFHLKNKKKSTLSLAIGLSLMACGELLQIFAPYKKITLDQFQNVVEQSGPPLSWYYGSLVISAGLLITALSFAFVVMKYRLQK